MESSDKEERIPEYHRQVEAGRRLASPAPGDEVVITGIAGRFADADDVYKYRDNLLGQVSMVSKDNRRWRSTHPEVPHPSGKINCIEKFDAGFFGVHYRQAQHMDPACRQLLERAFEAVLDAGFHPDQLIGTRTGVYIGATYSETEKTWFFDKHESPSFAGTGVHRSTLAHWISYCMGLKGRSCVMSTACSTAAQVINDAYIDIRQGKCDSALVGATNLCLHPMMSLALYRLGILCLDGQCKSFDQRANGYVRSEGVAVIFLQKASNSRRIYSQLYHVKTNCDGYKEQGIQQPSPIMQQVLVNEVYEECNMSPQNLDYFEAHATGTHVGDYIETNSIDQAICSRRKTPLYVGSTKSLLGHTEATSAISAIVKMIIAMEHNCLLPNSNYKYPRKELKGIQEGRMVVVTKQIPWPIGSAGFTAVNSFGFGGTNGHIVLKRFWKQKLRNGEPIDDLPRLVCVSGRTKESILKILDDVKHRRLDGEFVRLLHEVFRDDIAGHLYRGYSIVSKTGEIGRSHHYFAGRRQSLSLVFGNLGKKWPKIAASLFLVPLFQDVIQKIDLILSTKGIKINDILHQRTAESAFNDFIGGVTVQIALAHIFKTLEISYNHIIGFSGGELSAAYTDGVLTLEQAILIAYYGMQVINSEIRNNYTSHTTFSEQTCLKLLRHFQKLITKPKQWSDKWVATSPNKEAPRLASAEYFTNAFLTLSTFPKITSISPDSVVVNICSEFIPPHNLTSVNLVENADDSKTDNTLLCSLGRLYELGYNPKLEKLYPQVKWPVSVGTPMISPLIKWNHADDWFVPRYEMQEDIKYSKRIVTFSIGEPEWTFITGHVLNGHNIMPAMGYLHLVWETVAMAKHVLMTDMQVVFENVKFHRATNIPETGNVKLTINVHKVTGKFEIEELGESIVTGKIYNPEDISNELSETWTPAGTASDIIMTTEDIYKLLKLRGHDYTGAFRELKECDMAISKALLEWKGNWVAFVDNMLQMQLLQRDTKQLYVPVGIERLVIDAEAHVQYAKDLVQNSVLPVYVYKESVMIRSGAIEIRGMSTSPISRSKTPEEPLLETYKYIPERVQLSLQQSVRVITQILLENTHDSEIRVVEAVDEEFSSPLGPSISQVLNDYSEVQHGIVNLSKDLSEVSNTNSEKSSNCHLVVIGHGLRKPQVMENIKLVLNENGFILSRENINLIQDNEEHLLGLTVISIYQTEKEKLVLLRKTKNVQQPTVINVEENSDIADNISQLETTAQNGQEVIMFAQEVPLSGILGLTKHIRSTHCNTQSFFIVDEAPKFDTENNFYSNQIKKGLSVNVFKDGAWGSYRHLLLENQPVVQCQHIFSNVTERGDLSSLSWIEGPSMNKAHFSPENVQVYYASINSRDVMFASGRISIDTVVRDCIEEYKMLGTEFSGRDATGRRVMGLVSKGALASMVTVDSYLTWEIPSEWSMEDAATVPAAYVTVLYALVMVSTVRPYEIILIHDGASAVGQAAIIVATHHKCKIFATVGNQAELNLINKRFPQIPENHIGSSQTTSFEQMIIRETQGYGVDVVLNSLPGEKLHASARCLAPGGRFLDLLKPDATNSCTNGLDILDKSRSFHGISLDALIASPPSLKKSIKNVLIEGLRMKYIRPLHRTVFEKKNVEQAFRHMAAHKHIGKVIVNIRSEEPEKIITPTTVLFNGLARYYCNEGHCYVIIGALTDFCVELMDWLVKRGARNILLVSGQEIESGYQHLKINIWKSYGINVDVLTTDMKSKEMCQTIINEALKLGPVAGVFNLELMTNWEHQTDLSEKIIAVQRLNDVTRETCSKLQDFVILLLTPNEYSQVDYAFATSKIERICEQRRKDGYPALVIRWGAIKYINSLPENEDLLPEQSTGILPQSIPSCLSVMDTLLKHNEHVVSSTVLTQKEDQQTENYSTVEIIMKIIGLKDLKTVSTHTTLSELGMDSIVAVEVKQILEKEFKTTFTAHDIRNMSFDRLQGLTDANLSDKGK